MVIFLCKCSAIIMIRAFQMPIVRDHASGEMAKLTEASRTATKTVEVEFSSGGEATVSHGTDRQRHFRGRYGDSSSRLANIAGDPTVTAAMAE